MTTFKDIIGFEGKYQIGDDGTVRTLRAKKKPFLKPRKIGKGYLSVDLSRKDETAKGGIRHQGYYIHRLVAQYFIPNPDPEKYTEVRHKDGDKENNLHTNLFWSTPSQRISSMIDNASKEGKKTHIKLSKEDIREIRRTKKADTSIQAQIYGITPGYANMIKRGVRRVEKPIV